MVYKMFICRSQESWNYFIWPILCVCRELAANGILFLGCVCVCVHAWSYTNTVKPLILAFESI